MQQVQQYWFLKRQKDSDAGGQVMQSVYATPPCNTRKPTTAASSFHSGVKILRSFVSPCGQNRHHLVFVDLILARTWTCFWNIFLILFFHIHSCLHACYEVIHNQFVFCLHQWKRCFCQRSRWLWKEDSQMWQLELPARESAENILNIEYTGWLKCVFALTAVLFSFLLGYSSCFCKLRACLLLWVIY